MLLALITGAIFSTRLWADPYPYLYRSAYFLGRGDTGIAIANDEDAIFYNPAGIAQGSGIYKKIVIASPMLEVSADTKDVVRKISLEKGDPTDTLREHEGRVQHAGINEFSGIVLRRAALGAFVHGETDALLYKDPTRGAFEGVAARAVADLGATFSLADWFFKKNFTAGFTGKLIRRAQGKLDANATETDQFTNLNSDSLAMVGQGTGADFGMMYKSTGRNPASVGLTVQDIGDTHFIPTKTTTIAPADRPLKNQRQTVNLGMAVEPGTKMSRLRLLFDMRDLAGKVEKSAVKRSHFGTELSVVGVLGFTAGLNQGYGAFGLYVDTRIVRFDIGMYTEEMGAKAGDRPDKRFYLRLMVGL